MKLMAMCSRPACRVVALACLMASLMLSGAARADAVLDWNGVLLDAIRGSRTPPPIATRYMALLNMAVFDSANAAVGLRYEPYSYDGMPITDASPEYAARAAAAAIIHALYPDLAARQPALAARIAALEALPAGAERADALGRACADAILKARAGDGSQATVAPFMGGTQPGMWRPEGPRTVPGLLPQWGGVAPWAIHGAEQFRIPPAPAIGSVAWLDAFNAVKSLGTASGGSHTDDHSLIALFWADDEGTETPPGHWMAIAGELAARRPGDVVDHARLFALLALTMADTATVVWQAKYTYALWRPISAIRNAHQLGNPRIMTDAGWTPFLETPSFPEYPSGHSAFSAAAARVLARVLGGDDIAFETGTRSPRLPGVRRHYDRLSAAAEEAGLSRIYGGIHFYFSHLASAEVGRKLADFVVESRLRPLHQ